jgi:hypothetical protein
LNGVFVLLGIGPKAKPWVQRFAIGDVTGMAAEAWSAVLDANMYFAPAIYRKGLAPGARGTANDIVAVLGLVIDDDGDTGKRAVLPSEINTSLEITTCTKPTVNRHIHYVFTRPLPPSEAKEIAELLHRKCGGDHGTKDIAHVWLTARHPKLPERSQARAGPSSRAAACAADRPVHSHRSDPGELRRALEAMPDLHPARATNAGDAARRYTGGSTSRDEIIARLPGWLNDHIEDGGGAWRSVLALLQRYAVAVRARA